nr:RasGEF domain-containing protein [Legionella sp. PL877]
MYSYIERSFACGRANIINCKLREAFTQLNADDFSNPSGFTDIMKASSRVKRFLEERNILEYFIKEDICCHNKRDIQLNTFRRWLSVANLLKKNHCYEGYFLVVNLLLTIDIDYKFSKELPKPCQKDFAVQCEMISPLSNFRTLRNEIALHKSAENLTPVFLRSKDIISLNEVLGDEEDSIGEQHPKYKTLQLKQRILQEITSECMAKSPELAGYLQDIYAKVREKYEGKCLPTAPEIKKEDKDPPKVKETAESSRYYSRLLPSLLFRGCKESSYWKKMFYIPESNNSGSSPKPR